MAVGIFPLAVGAVDQSASDKTLKHENVWGAEIHGISSDAKIGLSEHKDVLKVNAATKVKVKVWYKKWYRSHGKWRYVWRYYWKYKYTKVKAASSYSSSYYKSSGKADTSDPTLDAIMRSGSKYRYSSAYHTGADLAEHGSGDCWAFSDYLNTKFKAAGYQSRVIQYATSYSSRHRSVQLYQNGQWKTVPYRAYGYPSLIV